MDGSIEIKLQGIKTLGDLHSNFLEQLAIGSPFGTPKAAKEYERKEVLRQSQAIITAIVEISGGGAPVPSAMGSGDVVREEPGPLSPPAFSYADPNAGDFHATDLEEV